MDAGEYLKEKGEQKTVQAWNPLPPWLRLTGLPMVVGPAAMTVFERLLAKYLARRTMERKPQTPDGEALPKYSTPYTQEDLARRLGYKDRGTISRALKTLEAHHLIERVLTGYHVEGKAVPSWASLNLNLLYKLYQLTADAIPRGLDGGGLHGHEVTETGGRVQVCLFQGDDPVTVEAELIGAAWPLGADTRYAEALCADPASWEDISRLKRAQVKCAWQARQHRRNADRDMDGYLGDYTERALAEAADACDWLPEELAEYVEKFRKELAS